MYKLQRDAKKKEKKEEILLDSMDTVPETLFRFVYIEPLRPRKLCVSIIPYVITFYEIWIWFVSQDLKNTDFIHTIRERPDRRKKMILQKFKG